MKMPWVIHADCYLAIKIGETIYILLLIVGLCGTTMLKGGLRFTEY
jgi:hypothetical protein